MTDLLQDPADSQPTELQLLKDRAKLMGIPFSNNISIETLKAKIDEKMSGKQEPEVQAAQANPLAGEMASEDGKPVKRKTLRQHLYDENMKLVRVRIQCLDPKKANLPGEVLTVANEYIGNVKKFIPYGEATDGGYHIPMILYKTLEARRFLNIRTVRDKRTGATRPVTSWNKEFAIEVLPPLTAKELHQLATAQIAAGSVDVHAE
ncbi:hypothetical protein [Caballeronia sp. LZ034LL]|uniref:hypothetical protein n=1 Tax=Caballeronia sp. LZ034LL TaxID=3038567 RepID=UPI002865B13A|nr:hypothetical protein [Caballeronia sp. LZ034LL]MDR5839318.1 hypothetical protein [Caballeronia sp. LZ034LL]